MVVELSCFFFPPFANVACAIYDKQSARIVIFIPSCVVCLSHSLPAFMMPHFHVFIKWSSRTLAWFTLYLSLRLWVCYVHHLTTGWMLSTIPWFSWILNSWHYSWVIEAVTLFNGWLPFLHFLIIYVTVSSHPLIFPSLSPVFQSAYLLQCLFQIIYFSVRNVPFGYFPPSLSSSQLYSCFTLNILPLISTAY